MFYEKLTHKRDRVEIAICEGDAACSYSIDDKFLARVEVRAPSGEVNWQSLADSRPAVAAAVGRALVRASRIGLQFQKWGKTTDVAFPYREGDPVIGDGGVPFEVVNVNPDGTLDLAALETAAPRLIAEEISPAAVRPDWDKLI